MGGDRDGNPFVTPEATREVTLAARLQACTEYEIAVQKLMYELSVWRCNGELKVCHSCAVLVLPQPLLSCKKLNKLACTKYEIAVQKLQYELSVWRSSLCLAVLISGPSSCLAAQSTWASWHMLLAVTSACSMLPCHYVACHYAAVNRRPGLHLQRG